MLVKPLPYSSRMIFGFVWLMAFCVLVVSDNYQSMYQVISADDIRSAQMNKVVYTNTDTIAYGNSAYDITVEVNSDSV